ncbi:sigma-54 interaction domain-containing protein [Sporomusa sp.]|uniref:sigma-54 interaction domain-containing protein n=1 Tax=Sporomusa sp. TaxID=2078658 RepID=UPI002CC8596D|nr:sigma 54-interacting transcriptional regulator [Sporomusa sp.]HWR05746.1 sigma 54-interacting transcriptional regulator [Sporomusa sp.]
MEILKNNDWCKISEAYQLFINTGHIVPGAIRPRVEDSWRRSQRQSINPWTPRPQPIDDAEFAKIMLDNAELVEFARPVMQYMHATNTCNFEDNLVHLVEKNGTVLEFCSQARLYPNPRKKRATEAALGTSVTSIVLADQEPMELGGSENYKVCYQTCFGGASPIKDASKNLLGVLTLYNNNYGKIPEQPLKFVIAAAELIEDLLKDKVAARKQSVESNDYFTKMINCISDYIVVVDKNGHIINCNNKFAELLENNRGSLIGEHSNKHGINMANLTGNSICLNKGLFTITADNRQGYTCRLQNNKTVRWLNNQEHTLLLFSLADALKPRTKIAQVKDTITSFDKIIYESDTFARVISMAKRAAIVPTNVLLDGESGTGKDVIARAIHNGSARASQPFIAINCGSMPKELLQSEFFGYEEGAFTGGKRGGQAGKFEMADEGTIFLDEIGEMPLEMQVSLLRFLQDRTITRVGGHLTKKIDVRIIAATNRNLKKQVEDGLFREDLYYRLKVIHITLPPLRDRHADILVIADYYLEHYARLYRLRKMTLTGETRHYLCQYNWPGNIRELANVIENAVVFTDGDQITPDLLATELLEYLPCADENSKKLKQQEKEIIMQALSAANGNVSNAAKSIGISRNTMYRKIDKYGLQCLR